MPDGLFAANTPHSADNMNACLMQYGLESAKPAASAGTEGMAYYSSDTGILWYDNGGTWVDISGLSDQAAGTASKRTLGTGSTQSAAGDHGHSLVEVQTVEEEQFSPAAPASTGGGTAFTTSMTTIETATFTVGGSGKNAIITTGVFTAINTTGNSDGHTARARLLWDNDEVLITSYSAQIDNNEGATFVLTHLEPDVATGSKTGAIQAQKSGGTGNLGGFYYGLALLEANV